ncbi:MAG: hypothetical protein Q9195_006958 [Heterodermia aff. obscurata]
MDPVRPKGMARRISVGLPTHLKLERSNYGYQPAAKPTYATSSEGRKKRTWFTATELTTSILVLLPYVILQATNNVVSASRSLEKVLAGKGLTSMPRHATPGLLSACALTSGTLVIVGGTSKIRTFIQGQDETKSVPAGHKRTASFTTMQVGSINIQRGRQVAGRLFGVGLPFYSTIHLGSDRVGLIMLVALIADIAIADNEPRDFLTKSGAKRLLSSRRWTLATMLLQLVCDLAGLTAASSLSEALLGYLALSIWVFALPSPFPTMTAKKAYVSSPVEPSLASESNRLATLKETAAATQTVSPPDSKVSPLVYTSEDVDLTLIVGLILGLLTSLIFFFMIPIANESFLFSLIGGGLAAGTSALALTNAQPHSLRQSRGVGLALGSVLSGSFLILNFGFMLVQTFYGVATGSLGLLSDSIHMFFDCLALVVGLCAAVMSKWPPSTRFPYGFGKMDTLAGFANGIFLMLISVEIVYEAAERLAEGSQMHRLGELLTVSGAGLVVNIIVHAGSHDHGHGHHHHHHGNENMHGIFLHIMADTLGSVAVVISTLLIQYYGWVGFDPLASVLIAVLIFASAIPLVKSSARTLLLTIPEDTEFDLREALAGVSALRGVVGYAVPKFWLEEGDDRRVLGVIHVVAARGANMEDVKERAVAYLKTKGKRWAYFDSIVICINRAIFDTSPRGVAAMTDTQRGLAANRDLPIRLRRHVCARGEHKADRLARISNKG